MNAQTVLFRARVDQQRLVAADEILNRLGLTAGDAVNALLAQIVLRRCLPFPVSLDPSPSCRQPDTSRVLSDGEQGRYWEEAFGEY